MGMGLPARIIPMSKIWGTRAPMTAMVQSSRKERRQRFASMTA